MQITPHCVAGLTWTLQDTLCETLDTLDAPVEFFIGGGDLLPAIEHALHGKQAGDQLDLHLEPERAFGDYDEMRVHLLARKHLPKDIEPGAVIEAASLPAGTLAGVAPDALLTVTELYPEHAVLDGNHPLAGIALRLHLQITAVRPATAEELHLQSAGTGFFKMHRYQP
ncbi:MAG: FKBP-type peptidyl-prolyl cis-trans isomerase [Burkholderiaceae bacterium]|jgi:FKBP-type peptidyl-prolyl cis-trans isomerase SlyD|nr:FKBP-type peptidyl-prolyl cis-trans isomerase [Burkholderiaceae bacterium]